MTLNIIFSLITYATWSLFILEHLGLSGEFYMYIVHAKVDGS